MGDEGAAGVARTTVNGALYLGASQIIRLILTTISTVVVSRLLTPDDYGVLAMVAPMVALVVMFQDLGLSTATIQQREIDPATVNALFWLNVAASVTLAILMCIAAPIVGWFFKDPRTMYVTAASGITILVSGCALQHAALLNRDLRFGALSCAEIFNAAVTFFVSALTAYFLRSYWALYLGILAGSTAQSLVLWLCSTWRPSLSIELGRAKQVALLGGHVTGFNLLNYIVRNSDTFLIARASGAITLGFYDRSYKLMMLPIQSINAPLSRLLLPVMSRLQNNPDRYRQVFVIAVRIVMLAIAPGVAVGISLSHRVIPFLLGPQWSGASSIFFWLGLTGLVQPIANMTGVVFLSSGRTGLLFRWGLFSAIVTLIGFGVGIMWGAIGVAISLFVTAVIRLPILFWLCATPGYVRQSDLYRAQLEPLAGAAVGALVSVLVAPLLATGPLLCVAVPVSYIITVAMATATQEGRATVLRMATIVRGLLVSIRQHIVEKAQR